MKAEARELLPVLFPFTHQLAYMATYPELRAAQRAGKLETYGTKQRVYGAILFEGPNGARVGETFIHDTETETNPPRVWEFDKIEAVPTTNAATEGHEEAISQ